MFRSLRISNVEFRFPGSEKLGPSRNGGMERNFPVIPIFRNFRPTSRGTPKISEWNSGKCLFHSLPNPGFPEFLVAWKASTAFPLPKNGADHETAENTCNGEVLPHLQLKLMTARNISCTAQTDHDEANEIVQHNKRPMGIPFLTPMNDRILNWASLVGVAQ